MKNVKIKQHSLGFFEVDNKPTLDELEEYYSKMYYQENKGSYQKGYSPEELALIKAKLSQKWEFIKKIRGNDSSGYLLDVGCGEGFTLSFFRNLQWKVRGLDYNAYGLEVQNPTCHDCLVTGDVFKLMEDEFYSNNRYDIIWLQNVLEHVLEPITLMNSLHDLLDKNGILVITVPNDFSLIQNHAIEKGYIDNKYWISIPDHISYFNYESLHNIIQYTRWYCLDILADFPIDWFLLHQSANYISNRSQGKSAHKARVKLEILIDKNDPQDVNCFFSNLAKLGFGRNLTAFVQNRNTI